MIKIFDASINKHAPKHRVNSLGPKENDMMFDLKRYSNELGIQFVDDFHLADRIITNTTYTPEIIEWSNSKNIPLIKRMDGVFWRNDLVERNIPLNLAAIQSDDVIFISEFSKNSFHTLYPDQKLNDEWVILNNVDETIFNMVTPLRENIRFWGTSATNWDRDEKRPIELLQFADICEKYGEKLVIIGKSGILHEAVINVGYYEDYILLSETINKIDAWVNFSYMDAAPKTVLQAISCGRPVLYVNSGGLPELVGDFGVSIPDNQDICFDNHNAELDFEYVEARYHHFKMKYINRLFNSPIVKPYLNTLKEYAEVIKNSVKH